MSSAYLRLLIFLLAVLIPACASSSPAFLMMYSAYKLNKQGDNIQPWCTPFRIGTSLLFHVQLYIYVCVCLCVCLYVCVILIYPFSDKRGQIVVQLYSCSFLYQIDIIPRSFPDSFSLYSVIQHIIKISERKKVPRYFK